MLGLIADQDGGYDGIFVPFFGKMAATPSGPAYFSRNLKLLLYLFLLYVKKVIMGIRQSSKILFTMKIPAIGSWMTIALH